MGFGLVFYDMEQHTIVPYRSHPVLKNMGYTSTVNDIIYRKRTNELCFATWDDGVWFYNVKAGKAHVVNTVTNPELSDICIYSLLEDSKGNLWLGTRSGVFILDTEQRLHSLNELVTLTNQALPQISIFKMAEDQDGFIWIATSNEGVWRIDTSGETYKVKFYTPSDGTLSTVGAMSVCVDGYNRVWVGSNGNGLDLYDRKNDRFVSVLNDYFRNGDVVFSMLEDDKHTLWLTTNAEMYHIDIPLDGAAPKIHTYTVDDGLQDHMFNRNSCFKGADGKLIFGGFRGLNSFYPDKIVQDTAYSPVVITDIKVHNVSVRTYPLSIRKGIVANRAIDFIDKIVYGYEGMEKYGQRTDATKPLIQCEYAHAMGNSQGGFKEYWDLIRKYPNLQGGFIWDFVDQSCRWKGKDGVMIYAYGGDFNRFDASDNNFCDNGLISPDRVPNPHMYEVGYFYQNIWTTPADLSKGEVNVFNENFFRDLSAYYMEWQVLKDGKIIRTGRVDDLKIAPQETAKITLNIGKTCTCKEWLLNVSYKLKNREGLLPAGFTVAKNQLTLNDYKAPSMDLKNVETTNVATVVPQIIDNQYHYLIVKGNNFVAEFNKQNGYLSKYAVDGTEMLKEGAALTPNFWRAPTDNDMGAGLQNKYAAWKNPGLKLISLNSKTENDQIIVNAEYDMKNVSAKLYLTYVINNEGAIKVTQKMTADKNATVSPMFRFGMQMQMPKCFETVEYYGRGPVENYSDRNHSTDLGIYRQSVNEQFYSYIRPQETGTKTDIRWWKQLNAGGNGLKVVGDAPFSASALHYTICSLDDGEQKDQRHSPEVQKADLTNLIIDKAQMGLGCVNSWGALPLPQYMLPYGDYEFTFILTPVKHQIEIE